MTLLILKFCWDDVDLFWEMFLIFCLPSLRREKSTYDEETVCRLWWTGKTFHLIYRASILCFQVLLWGFRRRLCVALEIHEVSRNVFPLVILLYFKCFSMYYSLVCKDWGALVIILKWASSLSLRLVPAPFSFPLKTSPADKVLHV